MEPTQLLYLEINPPLHHEATVIACTKYNDKDAVILDKTIFYPQGGGQPYDFGEIISGVKKFSVCEVRFAEGLVYHLGSFQGENFLPGEKVQCSVDELRRELHSRLHSAGHLVDLAIAKLNLNWIPGKGYHFPDGPYVEYAGSLENYDKDKLKSDLERVCNELIVENVKTSALFVGQDELATYCRQVPDFIPAGKPIRVVRFGDFGVACGGTHVQSLDEIKKMTIRKIKSEGANLKVSYDVSRA